MEAVRKTAADQGERIRGVAARKTTVDKCVTIHEEVKETAVDQLVKERVIAEVDLAAAPIEGETGKGGDGSEQALVGRISSFSGAGRKLIMLQFPEIELKEIKQLGEGFDNTVIQINGQFVFRFPRRPIAVTLIQVENQLLPSIAGTFPLAIPEPIFLGNQALCILILLPVIRW